MTTRFFRTFWFAACAALLVLAAACSKKGEAEVNSSADAKGEVKADATASASDTAKPADTPPTSTAPATANNKVPLTVRVNDGTGLVELKPDSTVDLPYRTSVLFDPPLPMSAVSVKAGPFRFQESTNGVVAKFEPNKEELERLDKGEKLDTTFQLANLEYKFRVGMLK